MMIRNLVVVMLSISSLLGIAKGCAIFCNNLKIENVWIKYPLSDKTPTSAYLKITETAGKSISLIGVQIKSINPDSSNATNAVFMKTDNVKAELHTHEIKKGPHGQEIMEMKPITEIKIKARETIELKPGHDHVMIYGLPKGVEKATSVIATLNFKDTDNNVFQVDVEFPFQAEGKNSGHHHHHSH